MSRNISKPLNFILNSKIFKLFSTESYMKRCLPSFIHESRIVFPTIPPFQDATAAIFHGWYHIRMDDPPPSKKSFKADASLMWKLRTKKMWWTLENISIHKDDETKPVHLIPEISRKKKKKGKKRKKSQIVWHNMYRLGRCFVKIYILIINLKNRLQIKQWCQYNRDFGQEDNSYFYTDDSKNINAKITNRWKC